MGIAVLAEPGTMPPSAEELGDLVSVFQLPHGRTMETHTRSRVSTSWYAGRLDAVSPSRWVPLRRRGAGGYRVADETEA